MIIISYDVASKSLALSVINFNENWKRDLNQLLPYYDKIKEANIEDKCDIILIYLNKLNELLDNIIEPILFDVVDLIPGKKLKETDTIMRAERLKAYLNSVDDFIRTYNVNKINKTPGEKTKYNIKVLLEYQMGPNDKSRNVGSQILYHYSNYDNGFKSSYISNPGEIDKDVSIEIIGPSLKNKINLDPANNYQSFIRKYTKTYDANKKHSIANMMIWLKQKNKLEMISKIKKSNYDDIADAITMTLAWIYLKNKNI